MMEYSKYRDSGIPWIGKIPAHWNILRGKNILMLLERPVQEGDDIITCFRDGEVTLRKNRREEGFTVSMKEIGYQGVEPGDLVVHGMDGFAGAIGVSDSRESYASFKCNGFQRKQTIFNVLLESCGL